MLSKKSIMFFNIIIILFLVLAGCSNKRYDVSNKEKEPVVVILDESSNKDNESKSNSLKDSNTVTKYSNYKVNLKIDPVKRTFEGIQKVNFTNNTKDNLEGILFNLYLNAYQKNSKIKPYVLEFEDKVYKEGFDEGFILIESVLINNAEVVFNQSETFLDVILNEPVSPDEEIEITIQFKGKTPKASHKMGANDKVMWMGNFLPVLSVYDENGWNRYSSYPIGDSFFTRVSNYSVSVTTPKEYTVVGTGIETEIENETEKTTTIEAKMVRDFALAISNKFHTESIETKDNIAINLYYTSSIGVDEKTVLEIAEKTMELYSNTFGSYPYAELDIIEGNMYNSSGAEYSALVVADYKVLRGISSQEIIAHLIGHQWFYNIVGNNPIKEPWLDEALITYLTNYIFYTEDEIDIIMKNKRKELNKIIDPMRETSLNSELGDFSTWDSYYNIHYYRGEIMFHALRDKMGEEKFQEFLKKYYEQYAYKIAKKEGFMELAEETYGSSLRMFFYQWMKAEKLPKF
ncbi:MAG: M1 family metallopeptidase [Epulopiscium sp.]|nr:M1 family metallopeptidase [Candidatus Epulonipiscium sp.]